MASNPATLTVPSPPTAAEVAADLAAWIGGQSGVLTDLNTGSQVRTEAEAVGSVVEMQTVISQAQAFQAMVYAAWAAFNVFPYAALQSIGTVTFSTGTGASPPAAPYAINVPVGTIVQTVGGIQFQTTAAATIVAGGTSVNAPVEAVVAGAGGNVAASAIAQIASSLAYPLQVTNTAPTTGGADAETPAQTMARFTAVVASIGLATPVAVANGVIGVSVSGTAEKVEFATVYEPWIDELAKGQQNPSAGFDVYVDNGSGAASSNLLSAVSAALSGNAALGEAGFRPAGVPYNVYAVQPVFCSVSVSGTALDSSYDSTLDTAVSVAVNQYFNALAFGQTAQITQLIAAVANQTFGNVLTLDVTMLNASGVAVQYIAPTGTQRVILQNLSVDFT